MSRRLLVPVLVALATPPSPARADDTTLRPQVQLDLGLSIAGPGYEHPISDRVAVMVGGGIFGTYFLPWFDLGDRVAGAVGDLRVTWFRSPGGRGLYVTPYVRGGYASGTDEDTGAEGSGPVVTGGFFVGYALGLGAKLDLRLGGGAQYIYVGGDNDVGARAPFVAIDITVGYRL